MTTDTTVRFLTQIEAIRYEGSNLPEVMALLGYEVQGDQIIFGKAMSTKVPVVELHQHYNEQTELRITLPLPDSPELVLNYGMWLVKIGNGFAVMLHGDFLKMEVAL